MKPLLVAIRCGPEYDGPAADKIRALPLDEYDHASDRGLWITTQVYDGYIYGTAIGNDDGQHVRLGGIHLDFVVVFEPDDDRTNEGARSREAWMLVYDCHDAAGLNLWGMSWDM